MKITELMILVVGLVCALNNFLGIGPKIWFVITVLIYVFMNSPKFIKWVRRKININ